MKRKRLWVCRQAPCHDETKPRADAHRERRWGVSGLRLAGDDEDAEVLAFGAVALDRLDGQTMANQRGLQVRRIEAQHMGRLADGTQMCWRTLTGATGAGVGWTFPAVFVAAPVVTGGAVATVQSAVVLDAAPSATACTLSARGTNDARRADVMHLAALGRWF